MSLPAPGSSKPARWWAALAMILAVATVLRLCNLGTFSLALDEVFTMTRAALPFPDMIAACAADADNVPVYLVITSWSIRLGLTDPWLRLVPIAAGLASIVTWAWWTRRMLGPGVSLLAAGFMALSTFHIRYSQELRAYPYLLLIAGLAMVATDRLRRRADPSSALLLACVVGVGWYTHFSFAMLLPPILGLSLVGRSPDRPDAGGERRRMRAVAWTVAAVAAGTMTLIPWFLRVERTLRGHLSRGANDWTLDMVARRWEFLTVAARESQPADWLGLLIGALAVAGLVRAFRLELGRKVLIPAACALLAGEVFLVAVNRWSQGRYDAAVWPFLVVLVALGATSVGSLTEPRWLRAGLVALAILVMLPRVDAYHRNGRPHWDRVAHAVAEARRPGEPLFAENRWSETCINYYSDSSVTSLDRSPARLLAAAGASPSVLVFAPYRYRQPSVQRLARQGALVAAVPGTGRLLRLRPDMLDPTATWPDGRWPRPSTELVSASIEAAPQGCLARFAGIGDGRSPRLDWSRLELDAGSLPALRGGWSPPRVAHDGASYRQITGREAGIVVDEPIARPVSILIHLWSARGVDGQQLRLLVNDQVVGVVPIAPHRQTVTMEAPSSVWRDDRNLLVLQLRRALVPGDGRSLPWSAAVDWIELAPTR